MTIGTRAYLCINRNSELIGVYRAQFFQGH
jgi:hypothetical protein